MGKITKINLQKTSKRANIFIDNKFAFGIDFDNLLKFGLKVGDEVNEKDLKKIIFKAETAKLFESMGKFLSLRPRTKTEILDKIRNKIFKRNLADFIDKKILEEQVLERIEKTGLVDDKKFAFWFVAQRNTFRPKSKRALSFELKRKGIDFKVINEALSDFDDQEAAFKLIEKKRQSLEKLSPERRKKRTISLLANRGFSWQIIKKALDFID